MPNFYEQLFGNNYGLDNNQDQLTSLLQSLSSSAQFNRQYPQNYYQQGLMQNLPQSQNLMMNNQTTPGQGLSSIGSTSDGFGLNPGKADLMTMLAQRESGGNYNAKNSLGYVGAFQFGAPALETVGYLKPGTGKLGNKALNDPNNWTIPGGLQAFLGNKDLQNRAMQSLMAANKRTLTNLGAINQNTPSDVVNGLLAAAHLAGPGGAKALLKGQNRKDAYGTGARSYFNLGRSAIT